jgi:uncharacterized membrane protein (DUF485 family)
MSSSLPPVSAPQLQQQQQRARSTALVDATRVLARRRWRLAATLTACMVLVYFGFIALVAFQPRLLGRLLSEGLSLGIVLGALVIVAAWLLTFVYVSWANRVYDPALAALRQQRSDVDG